MHSEQLFEAALGVPTPWYVQETRFDGDARTLTIRVDFRSGSRFSHPDASGEHPVHDTQIKRYRHLNFFQHECFLEVRVPRVKLPDGSVRLIEPPWAGKLNGFTLLFEALVLSLCREMPFAAVARLVGESWHRVARIAERYVEMALAEADYSNVHEIAIDETSKARGHDYQIRSGHIENICCLLGGHFGMHGNDSNRITLSHIRQQIPQQDKRLPGKDQIMPVHFDTRTIGFRLLAQQLAEFRCAYPGKLRCLAVW